MAPSAKTGKNFFRGSPEHFLDKNAIWDRTPPPTHQLQSTRVGEGSRVPNLQMEFNYLDSFKSYGIFSDFVVPTWSPSSSHHPHVVPVIPMLSPSSLLSLLSSCCPHSPQKVPMWSPWSVVSTCCPRHPCRPHVVPVIPTSSRRSLHHPQPPRYPLHPPPTPLGGGGPESVKMQ